MNKFADFHFIRPEWLYALIPFAILLWLLRRQRMSGRSWQNVVDPRLLAHLLIGQQTMQRVWTVWVAGLGGLLSILAMAGPTWQKLEVPVFRKPSELVVLLDLSRSMDAADIKPSRLQRAQLKLRDILDQQKEGETALIVFAATPFVVSPLTSDAKTIASQIESLTTDLMPARGSRPDRAIVMAQQLLRQSGASQGGVLLISDGIDDGKSSELKTAVSDLVKAGYRLSVLGVGTPEGAPVPEADGGFLKDRNGAIVLPRLDDTALNELARQGNGVYRRIGTDDSDFQATLAPFRSLLSQQQSNQADNPNGERWHSDQWRDEGPWLLLPVLLLGLIAFRRGYVVVLLLLVLPLPHPAYAFDWDGLWQRDDQRAQRAMQANDPKQAAQLFKNPEWRAAANYRAGNYHGAAEDLKKVDNADAYYNRGNALARQGQLQEALDEYNKALKRDPQNADAKFNRDLVEKLLEQSQQDQAKQESGQGDGKKQEQKNGQGQSPKPESGQSQSGQSGSESDSSRQDGKEGQPAGNNHQDAGKNGKGKDQSGQQHGESDAAREDAGGNEADRKNNSSAAAAGKRDSQQDNGKPGSGEQHDSVVDNGKQAAAVDGQQEASEMKQADKQWLRRIPDDPGGLWRRKFLYQYKQQQKNGKSEDKTW